MLEDKLLYFEVDNTANLKNIFSEIRADVDKADSTFKLDGLYYRAGYLITLVHDAFWDRKCLDEMDHIRDIAEAEFRETAHKINQHAEELGIAGNYDEVWAD
jgi:hypothetical protein